MVVMQVIHASVELQQLTPHQLDYNPGNVKLSRNPASGQHIGSLHHRTI